MKKVLILIVAVGLVVTGFYLIGNSNKNTVDDKVLVEQYVREHITELVQEETVLGGTWHVITIDIDSNKKQGTVTYEDGHIQGSAMFSYERNNQEVLITSFVSN